MTLGPVRWVQCENEAAVKITVTQEGETKEFPACADCWNECIERKMQVVNVVPIQAEKKTKRARKSKTQ